MKIECIRDHLGDAVGKAEKVSARNTTLPVLAGLYLEAGKNSLVVKATNLDIGVSVTLPVKVIEPGTVVVPAHVLSSLLGSLPSEKVVTITKNEQVLEVKTNTIQTHINTLPEEDFPIIPEIRDDKEFSLPARDLIFGLKSVIYAAAAGSMKPELSSISITHEGEFLVFAATDSFRLAEKKIKVRKIPHFKQILIPYKNATEIIRIFDKGEEEISLSIEEHQLALRSNNTYFISRIVEGVFPDYEQIIPKEVAAKAVILKQDLINALKTSLIFSDAFNQLTLHIDPAKRKFEIESKNNTVGDNNCSLDAVLDGESLSINLNYKYFTDCLQSVMTDSVSIEFSGVAKPVLVRPVGDTSFIYLVMPMNR